MSASLVSSLLHEGKNMHKHCTYTCGSYLVLIEVCDDDAYKQSESNHASQKHKDVDVDTMDLQVQSYLNCYSGLMMSESEHYHRSEWKGKVR